MLKIVKINKIVGQTQVNILILNGRSRKIAGGSWTKTRPKPIRAILTSTGPCPASRLIVADQGTQGVGKLHPRALLVAARAHG